LLLPPIALIILLWLVAAVVELDMAAVAVLVVC
jgi:hypothetical protein